MYCRSSTSRSLSKSWFLSFRKSHGLYSFLFSLGIRLRHTVLCSWPRQRHTTASCTLSTCGAYRETMNELQKRLARISQDFYQSSLSTPTSLSRSSSERRRTLRISIFPAQAFALSKMNPASLLVRLPLSVSSLYSSLFSLRSFRFRTLLRESHSSKERKSI